ncbi:MAG TPA: RidA family protein [Candidatus Nitrosopolaris sp.]|nr:RidA family protein [Candidatus Nitrosopolaris sp.]
MIEEKLDLLGITLQMPQKTAGSYEPVVKTGCLVFVSGQLPIELGSNPPRVKFKGKVGRDISISDGKQAAELCTINALAHIKDALHNLDEVKRFVRLSGFVNCDASFSSHSEVINGASDFLAKIFGDKGKHSRVAIGTSSLPLDSAVEIDFIIEWQNDSGVL